MLSSFDWIRRSRTGAELLATLRYLAEEEKRRAKGEELRAENTEQGEQETLGSEPRAPSPIPYALSSVPPPHSALNGPCQRCWIYPRMPRSERADEPYCQFCKAILRKTRGLGNLSRHSIVIWGFVNQLPRQLQIEAKGPEQRAERAETGAKSGEQVEQETLDSEPRFPDPGLQAPSPMPYTLSSKLLLGAYIYDENRFLLMMRQRKLRTWLQELVLYNGSDVKGLIQIFPTMGMGKEINMGDVLCRAVHHEANFPMDRLRVRFYSHPYQILRPHIRERQGLLTFEISEFLDLLGMVVVFRTILRPEEQKMLHEISSIDDAVEEQFYWGRFQGSLSQEAKDMLDSWNIRRWPKKRIKLLYELTDHVFISEFH